MIQILLYANVLALKVRVRDGEGSRGAKKRRLVTKDLRR